MTTFKKIEQKQIDMQNIERNVVNDNNVDTNDDLSLKKQYSKQHKKRSSLNNSSTFMTNSKIE